MSAETAAPPGPGAWVLFWVGAAVLIAGGTGVAYIVHGLWGVAVWAVLLVVGLAGVTIAR